MSSRWSRDNLITSHPARLYDGRILERIELEALDYLVQDLQRSRGPCQLGWGRMGVFTLGHRLRRQRRAVPVAGTPGSWTSPAGAAARSAKCHG